MKKNSIQVPLTVPEKLHKQYLKNYSTVAPNGRLFLFAGDQKIEHLNQDFYGKGISKQDASPQHLFEIASKSRIGAFATQLGLISRYAGNYRKVNYVVKLNSKTNLVPISQEDPLSENLNTVEQVVEFKQTSKLNIVGVGYTIYIGSEYEAEMLEEASEAIYEAHKNGLLAILWVYPKGSSVKNEFDANIIAGAAGVATCLGADFVKINPPKSTDDSSSAKLLKQATLAAGNTKVVCSGGKTISPTNFLEELHNQIHIGGTSGTAVGRNIHQKNLDEAIKFCEAVAAIIIDDSSVENAKNLLS